MDNEKGFTLIEVVVIMALIAIVVSIATPTFREMRENNQKKTTAFTLGSALNYARNEAITRGGAVTICRSANPNQADNPAAPSPVCSLAAGGWETGYIVFADNNGNGVRDAAEELLRAFPPPPGNLNIPGTGNAANRIVYTATGFGTNNAGNITIGNTAAGGGVDNTRTRFILTVAANARFSVTGPVK